MYQPEGFKTDRDKICKLNKSIYGLKQAPKAWNNKLNLVLINFYFNKSSTDPCLHTKKVKDQFFYLIINIADFIISCKDVNLIEQTY